MFVTTHGPSEIQLQGHISTQEIDQESQMDVGRTSSNLIFACVNGECVATRSVPCQRPSKRELRISECTESQRSKVKLHRKVHLQNLHVSLSESFKISELYTPERKNLFYAGCIYELLSKCYNAPGAFVDCCYSEPQNPETPQTLFTVTISKVDELIKVKIASKGRPPWQPGRVKNSA